MSEFIYGNESKKFGDLGPLLAAEIRARIEKLGVPIEPSIEGIRATVVGASQYTVQLSGSTIYVAPLDAVPLRNVPVIAPALPLEWRGDRSRRWWRASEGAGHTEAARPQRTASSDPVAVFVPWRGSATLSSSSTRSAAAWWMAWRAF